MEKLEGRDKINTVSDKSPKRSTSAMRSKNQIEAATRPGREGRQTVVETAVKTIAAGILSGRFAPGQRLIEADLTKELGISRNPLREAFGRLSAEGLVQIEAFKGAIVARPSRQELLDLFDVRECLEVWAARRAAQNAQQSPRLKEAKALAARLENEAEMHPNVGDYLEDNIRFHAFILDLAGNRHLPKLLEQLQFPIFQAAFFRMYDAKIYGTSTRDHRAILHAILTSNADAAEREVRQHVRHTADLLQSLPDHFFSPA